MWIFIYQSAGWERIITVLGHMSCQGSGLGEGIHGGGGNSGMGTYAHGACTVGATAHNSNA